MKKIIMFLICGCGPQAPSETTTSTTSVETLGNSTSITETNKTTTAPTETITGITTTTPTETITGITTTSANEPITTGTTNVISETTSESSDSGSLTSGEFCTTGFDCPLKKNFEPCIESIECEGGICITNEEGASFCTSSCNRIGIECEIGECFGENFCVHFCDIETCPENMICGVFFRKMVCFNN